jgi:hypothetical protein
LLQKPSKRYLEAVNPPANDDFEELHTLLSKAKERYRSVRATLVHTVDGTLAKEANRRFIDWRLDQGSPSMGIIGKPGPPQRDDLYHDYEDSEEWIRLWHPRPDLWREERRTPRVNYANARSTGAWVVRGGSTNPRSGWPTYHASTSKKAETPNSPSCSIPPSTSSPRPSGTGRP